MPPEPVPADLPPDPMSAEERAAWLDRVAEQDEPPDLEEWPDPEEELTAAELAEIREVAQTQGMKTLRESGLLKVIDGTTTVEEVLRVTLA